MFLSVKGPLGTQLQNRGHRSELVDIAIIPGPWDAFLYLLQGIPCTVTPRIWVGCSAASKSTVGGKTAIFQASGQHKHLGNCMPTEEDLLIRLQGPNPKGPFIDPGGHQAKVCQPAPLKQPGTASLLPCRLVPRPVDCGSRCVGRFLQETALGRRKTWKFHVACNTFSEKHPFLGRKRGSRNGYPTAPTKHAHFRAVTLEISNGCQQVRLKTPLGRQKTWNFSFSGLPSLGNGQRTGNLLCSGSSSLPNSQRTGNFSFPGSSSLPSWTKNWEFLVFWLPQPSKWPKNLECLDLGDENAFHETLRSGPFMPSHSRPGKTTLQLRQPNTTSLPASGQF